MAKDGAEDTQDTTQDVGSSESSEKQSSVELSKEQEAEVTKRVSNKLAAKGDVAKALEGRVKTLESENQKLQEASLKGTATKYGLTMEQVKEVGVDNSDRLNELAKLFGKEKKLGVLTDEPDGGEGSGGGVDTSKNTPLQNIRAGVEKQAKK